VFEARRKGHGGSHDFSFRHRRDQSFIRESAAESDELKRNVLIDFRLNPRRLNRNDTWHEDSEIYEQYETPSLHLRSAQPASLEPRAARQSKSEESDSVSGDHCAGNLRER
jgi:hypothetical protein